MFLRVLHHGRKRQGAWLVALAMLLSVAAPALAQQKAPEKPPPYKLKAGDIVSLFVTPQKGWDSEGEILPDGAVYLRRVGKVLAEGLSVDDLSMLLHTQLKSDLRNHKVLVTVKIAPPPPPVLEKPAKPRKVTVTGAVLKPGEIELEGDMLVFKAISVAGGATKDADLANITIIHATRKRQIVDLSSDDQLLSEEHNFILKDGDSIVVRELPAKVAGSVRIGGQVLNPGSYDYKPGMTLEDLITVAGKATLVSDLESVQFQRKGQAEEKIDLYKRQEQGLSGRLALQAGDEVFIPEVKDRVLLIGMLAKPGPRKFQPGHTLRQFFLDADGDQSAALNDALVDFGGVKVIRGGKELAKVNLKEVLAKEESKGNVALASGDVIFLPSRRQPKKDFLDYLGGLGPLSLLFGF